MMNIAWEMWHDNRKEGEVRSSHWGDFIANTVWINVRFARVENLHVKEPEVFEKFCQEEQNTIRRRVKIFSSFTKEETQMLFNLKMFATNKEVTQEVVNYLVKQKSSMNLAGDYRKYVMRTSKKKRLSRKSFVVHCRMSLDLRSTIGKRQWQNILSKSGGLTASRKGERGAGGLFLGEV